MPCPKCGADASDTARFCESCGARLIPDAGPPAGANATGAGDRCRCGAGPEEADALGYCLACGVKRPKPTPARAALPRDHVEIALAPGFAAVSDRGLRHANNQDDAALAVEDLAGVSAHVLVVCDGVSSAQEADTASALACVAARDALRSALHADAPVSISDMRQAIQEAHSAARTIPYQRDHETLGPPGTTLVAAVVHQGTITVGWAGDSRAYWLGPDGARMLTHDHSWVNEAVDAGEMSLEEALRSKEAHAITRCLGALNGDDPLEPSAATFPLPTDGGLLLLCSDGLWNYADTPEELAALVGAAPPETDARALCRRLVEFALAEGGRDNVTAAVLALGPQGRVRLDGEEEGGGTPPLPMPNRPAPASVIVRVGAGSPRPPLSLIFLTDATRKSTAHAIRRRHLL